MAKAGNVSDRGSTAWNEQLSKRPCPKCGKQMVLCVTARKWTTIWSCTGCGHTMPKTHNDWRPDRNPAQAEQAKGMKK